MNEFELTIENSKLKNELQVANNRLLEASVHVTKLIGIAEEYLEAAKGEWLHVNIDTLNDYHAACKTLNYKPISFPIELTS